MLGYEIVLFSEHFFHSDRNYFHNTQRSAMLLSYKLACVELVSIPSKESHPQSMSSLKTDVIENQDWAVTVALLMLEFQVCL